MKFARSLTIAAVLTVPGVSLAGQLYTGVGLPTSQGWDYSAIKINSGVPGPWAGPVITPLATGVQLNTMVDDTGYAGYAKQLAAGDLNRTTGFDLSFTLGLLGQHDNGNTRAGLSVTVLTSDSKGIELAFRPTFIFSQNATFDSFANQASINTTALTNYDLVVLGNSYTLSANGSPILSGALVSYPVSANPLSLVYAKTDYLAISDNTSEASGNFQFTAAAVVPEASSAFGLLALVAPLMRRRGK